MILRDTVSVLRRVLLPEPDPYGNDVYEDVPTPYPAEVRPLGSAETVGDRQTVASRYRISLPASAVALSATDAVTWRGIELELQGDVEPHTLGRTLHHCEVIAQRVTG